MKARSTTLAIAALTLWLVPSGGFAQGNSGKSRVTICHISPGNPDAQRTLRVPEPALHGHESHGDVLGPCGVYSEARSDEYDDKFGHEPGRAKKSKKKDRKEHRGVARSKRGTRPDAETDKPREKEQRFFRGMRRVFGFSEDENEE